MEAGGGVPLPSVPAGLTQVVVKGEAPQRRELPRPSCFLLGVLNSYPPQHYHYAKNILPVRYRD
jgi:hypothetical protein